MKISQEDLSRLVVMEFFIKHGRYPAASVLEKQLTTRAAKRLARKLIQCDTFKLRHELLKLSK